MSRTRNTLPWRLWADHKLPDTLRRWKGRHESSVGWYQRRHNRRDRHDARAQLRHGREPEPRQTRHRAHWDAF